MGMIDADRAEESPSLLGVCDGVSEVQSMGISPDEFPREFLRRFREHFESREWLSDVDDGSWVIGVMEDSFDATKAYGSTTVLLALMEDTNRLVIANLGDSCCIVLRPVPSEPSRLRIVFKTEPLRYDTNKPFQVARLAGVSDAKVRTVIKRTRIDTMPAQHGDLLVLGSDGLWDNLHDEDVVRIVEKACAVPARRGSAPSLPQNGGMDLPVPGREQLEVAADSLVSAALDSVCIGQMDESGQIKWPPQARNTPVGMGGKADDTTAIVAATVMASDATPEELLYKAAARASAFACGGDTAPERRAWLDTTCCGGSQRLGEAGGPCTVS